MKETLRIDLKIQPAIDRNAYEPAWSVTYVLNLETPGVTDEYEAGWDAVDPSELISSGHRSLSTAIDRAKAWAEGSGYKASPARPTYGNVIEIRLRRP